MALRNGNVDDTLAWVKRCIQRAKSGEDDVFSEATIDLESIDSDNDVFTDIGALVGGQDMQIVDDLEGFSQFENEDKLDALF